MISLHLLHCIVFFHFVSRGYFKTWEHARTRRCPLPRNEIPCALVSVPTSPRCHYWVEIGSDKIPTLICMTWHKSGELWCCLPVRVLKPSAIKQQARMSLKFPGCHLVQTPKPSVCHNLTRCPSSMPLFTCLNRHGKWPIEYQTSGMITVARYVSRCCRPP